ncbi:MAG: YbaB/EbfC family nucleoid-associated protein [Rhodospirillaceae bacterium]|nr:YbaB/EbfC family nucleoid-associated protein [Rhodospirillaceae bacterium]
MKNLTGMLKQAQQMQAKLAEMQEKLAELEVAGESGGGMVTVTMSGKHEIKRVHIDRSLVDPEEIEVLEDLVAAACNDARTKVERRVQEESEALMGGMKLPPGMKLPF